MASNASLICHANSVSVDGKGLLITGASGSGKSSLTLQMMALGAQLVADDQTVLQERDGVLLASAPAAIKNLIEARGLGILEVSGIKSSPIVAIVDLDQVENERLPQIRFQTICGVRLPSLHKVDNVAFPSALVCYLKNHRKDE